MIAPPSNPRPLLALISILLLVGISFRCEPVFTSEERMLQHFPTEDGYLMLTIARNIAIGNGMSVSDGEVPTNGTQPLTTLVWAGAFWLVDGDKVDGVRIVLIIELLLSLASLLLVYALGKAMLAHRADGRWIAGLAAAAWFASPLGIPHTMNCLETSAYVCLALVALLGLRNAASESAKSWSWGRMMAIGVVLGLSVWARNDSVFLVLAACLLYWTRAGQIHGAELRTRLGRVIVMGATSVFVTLPWLIHNQIEFGSIMPVSGHAEAYGASLGSNLDLVASTLLEYVTVVVQIPQALQETLIVEIVCFVILLIMLGFAARHWRTSTAPERGILFATAIYLGCLAAFYGLWFGAPHFLSRYFFPLSPVLAVLTVQAIFAVHRRLSDGAPIWAPRFAWLAGMVALSMAVGLNVRRYLQAEHHMHFQVRDWVRDNVPETSWIGAPQTGTIGFFHDRTINLDGKVNPEAYKHVVARTIPHYVVEKRLQFLCDWYGLADAWKDLDPIDREFEVLVNDADRNLSVLRLKGASMKDQ